jgi:TolB-like protein
LRADSETVAIDPSTLETDVGVFTRLACKSGPQDLESAAALYTGAFLAHLQVRDTCAEDWIASRRAELQSLLLRCLGLLMGAYRRLESYTDVERVAVRILELDPYDEEAHRGLITVHLARGQRPLAFRQFQRCRESLLRDLSVTPGPETEALLKGTVRDQIERAASSGNRREEKSLSVRPSSRATAENGSARGPSLIVAPLEVLGGEARAHLLAYGLVDDIVVHLSRFSSLFVVPPGLAVSLNLHPVDPLIVGSTFGVRYVLTGSVQAIYDRVRVASMLLDAENGRVVWAEHYDRRLIDFIGVRDDLARRIAIAASSSADASEFERLKLFDTNHFGAWELRSRWRNGDLLPPRLIRMRRHDRCTVKRSRSTPRSCAQRSASAGPISRTSVGVGQTIRGSRCRNPTSWPVRRGNLNRGSTARDAC